MKTIGLLGGMSWESTQSYYQRINEGVKAKLGGLHSAELVLYSVDFAEIETRQHQGDWAGTAKILSQAARQVEAAGAEALLICTNTMHKVAEEIADAITIPLLHIADATAKALISDGVRTVGLLGTTFTMEQNFYKGRLTNQHGLNVIIPEAAERASVHQIIYEELCLGKISDVSRTAYLRIIDHLVTQGAEAIILGCTEIGLLVAPEHTDVPLYDTTEIHARGAVDWALSD